MKKNFLTLALLFFVFAISTATAQKVKFAVISDLHPDIIPDSEQRMATFLEEAEKQNVDFIIELGDFCMVKPSNQSFVDRWNAYPGESYHTLGNHDMDNANKEQYMKFIGMPKPYYSFDKGDYHFIVLDANFIFQDGKYTAYSNGNYYGKEKISMIDTEQIEWLKEDLAQTQKKCVIFSHQSLEASVPNGQEVRAILENANQTAGYTKVVAAFSGHDHTSYEKVINGIVYIQINSASYQWIGDKYPCDTRYPKEMYQKFPSLKYTAPYKDPVYAVVTLGKKSLKIKGVQSEFLAPTPQELGVVTNSDEKPLTPSINNFKYRF